MVWCGPTLVPTRSRCCRAGRQFAVDILKVRHIILCGHYGCGGVSAVMAGQRVGLADNWLRQVEAVASKHQAFIGAQPTDAANVRQVQAGDAQTLTQANAYTDARIQSLNLDFSNFQTQLDDRFQQQDARISRVGAMGTAMSQMTASAAGIRTQNRLAVGTGFQNGYAAFAIGYQRAISERSTVTLGAAIGGDGEDTIGMGFGMGW